MSSSSSTPNNNNNMNTASALCSQGRKAWQEKEYSLALQHFGKAVRLLESSLGTFHPLVAKTYYWIGFIYKHSLPSSSSTSSSTRSSSGRSSSPSSNATQVEISYLLLALQAFTKSARIRLSLPEKKHDENTITNVSSSSHDKAIQEAKQAIQWVLRALQERYKRQSSGSKNAHEDDESKIDGTTSTSWKHQKAFKRLILHSRTSNSNTRSPPKNKSNQHTESSGCMYLDSLEESIRLEVKGDQYLRKHSNDSESESSGADSSNPCQYAQALESYLHSQTVFPDPHHASLWGKQAFCHHQLCSKTTQGQDQPSDTMQQQSAYEKYRQAYKIFQASHNMVLQVAASAAPLKDQLDSSSHHTTTILRLDDHPDTLTTMERLQQVVLLPQTDDKPTAAAIHQILAKTLTRSVRYEQSGDEALWHYEWIVSQQHQQQREQHYIAKAQQKYQKAAQAMTEITNDNGKDNAVAPYLCVGFCTSSSIHYAASSETMPDDRALCGQNLFHAIREVSEAINAKRRAKAMPKIDPPKSDTLRSSPASKSPPKTGQERLTTALTPSVESRYKQEEITSLLEQSTALRETVAEQDATIRNLQQQQKKDEKSRSTSLERQQRLLQEQQLRHSEDMEEKCQTIQRSQREIESLKAQISDLNEQGERQQQSMQRLEDERGKFLNELEEARREFQNCQQCESSLSSELATLQAKYNKTELQLKKAESEISLLDSRLKTSTKRCQDIEERAREELTAGGKESERRILELESNLIAVQKQLNKSTGNLTKLKEQHEITNAQSAEETLAKMKDLEELQSKLGIETCARKQENLLRQKLEAELLDTQQKYQEAVRVNRKTHKELDVAKEQFSLRSRGLNDSPLVSTDRPSMDIAALVEIAFEDVVFLREKLEESKAQIENIRDDFAATEKILASPAADPTDVSLKSTTTLAIVSACISEAAKLIEGKDALKKQVIAIQEDSHKVSQNAIAKARTEMQEYRADIESLRADKAVLERRP